MGKSLKEIIAALPPERQAKVNTRAEELIAEEKTQEDLRKAMTRRKAPSRESLK